MASSAIHDAKDKVKEKKYKDRCKEDNLDFRALGLGTGGHASHDATANHANVNALIKRAQAYGGRHWYKSRNRTWLTPSLSSCMHARLSGTLRHLGARF